MNTAQRKLKDATGRLTGITAHDGFLGHEALLQFVLSDDNRRTLDKIANEKLRSFRDTYRDFADRSEKLLRKGDTAKLSLLYRSWIQNILNYLGYENFQASHVAHQEEGQVPCLMPPSVNGNESHSVAVFFACAPSTPLRAFDTGSLTDASGAVHHKSSRQEPLTEQVERAMRSAGLPEAVLFMPHAAYYFRAESRTAGQCLEVRWDEIMTGDHDEALALGTFLLRSQFFAYGSQSEESSEEAPESEDAESEDEDEEASGGGGSVRLTASSQLFKEDLEQARKITEELHRQVVLALEILINERLAVDGKLSTRAKSEKHNEAIAKDLFKDGLFVLYRILFVLYAEARGFLPVQNKQFSSFYSVEHLRSWAEEFIRKNRRGIANPEGTYLWGASRGIFTLLRRGTTLKGEEQVSPYNGQLFADDRAPFFDAGPALRDEAMARVITALTRVGGEASGRRLHFANLGVEQLGAVYEALLAQKPVIIREPSVWVPAHGGGVGLVSEAMADALDMRRFEEVASGGRSARRGTKGKGRGKSGNLAALIDPRRPGYHPTVGKFIVAPLGGAKRQTASFYTPPTLAEFLVRRTLKPLVEGKSAAEIRSLKIVEPAMGSGGFVIATVRYLAEELLVAKRRERETLSLRDGEKADFKDLQRCKREIIESCIFGVDINPLAIELARTSLYLEALVPGEPLPFLHHRLKSGNSLIGADFQERAVVDWGDGQEFPMIFDLPIFHIKIKDEVWKAWDAAHPGEISSDSLMEQCAEVLRERKAERKKISEATWSTWASASQTKVQVFLQQAKSALSEFEKLQSSGAIVDALDARHKDHLSHIPDMDPVLIEAYEVEVDPTLVAKRRKALMTELGEKTYARMVSCQRAFHRLRALGDLSVALWYWPVDKYKFYPTHKTFQEMVNWLLNEASLNRKAKATPLSREALRSLRVALGVARSLGAFHWDLEYAQVFGDLKASAGFDACISNPPWKVVGVKDKEVYPTFDPQFLDTKPAQKNARIKTLYKADPAAATAWYEQSLFTSQMTEHWRHGSLSEIPPEGKVDLCALFVLRSERLVRLYGRTGLLVSRSALFVNKATKNIRQRFFKDWGLREACSFVNRLSIFEIGSNIEFTLLVGENGVNTSPRFVHGLTDPNTLELVARNLDARDVTRIATGPKPAELSVLMVSQYFSKENLSIPGITDPRQVEIAMALHRASGPVVYLNELDVAVQQGINQTTGPKKGQSEYTEKIPPHELPKWEDVLTGRVGKWVPLYRGRFFDKNAPNPYSPDSPPFMQYGSREVIAKSGARLLNPTVAWRAVGRSADKRTLVSCLLPPGVWADNRVFLVQFNEEFQAIALTAILSSLVLDFMVKLVTSSDVTKGVVEALPITDYHSPALDRAAELISRDVKTARGSEQKRIDSAKIDALIWLHYGQGIKPLDREGLLWILSTQFPRLDSHDPEYKHLVLRHYDNLFGEIKTGPSKKSYLFDKKILDIGRKQSASGTVEKTRLVR
jgi:hypothetical protein